MVRLLKFINRTLSVKLSLMIVCETALLLAAALLVVFHYSRQSIREEAMHNAEQTLEGTVQHIDNVLLCVEQTAGNVYWEMVAHLNEPQRMADYCRQTVRSNPYIVGCAIVFRPNHYPGHELFMAYVRQKDYKLDNEGALEVRHQFTDRPYTEQRWYTQPMETGRACWTDPLRNGEAEGEPLTSFCLPIFDRSGERIGVMAVDLPTRLLSQIVLAAKPSPNGYSSLLARNGSYIVHPDPVKLKYQTVFAQMNEGADHTVMEVAEAMVAGKTGNRALRMDGKDWYVFYKPFVRDEVPGRAMEHLGWSIAVVYPDDDIFGDYNRLLSYLMVIAMAGLLLFFVLCRLITHRQLLPLDLLTRSAQRIADGHYDETIPSATSEDEIGQLQNHFRLMQQSLAVQMGELERLSKALEERSAVLRTAYDKAQQADRMKTAFLHHMTNHMTGPSVAIAKSTSNLCDNYQTIGTEEAATEVAVIKKQSETIIKLLAGLIHTAENQTGKEANDE